MAELFSYRGFDVSVRKNGGNWRADVQYFKNYRCFGWNAEARTRDHVMRMARRMLDALPPDYISRPDANAIRARLLADFPPLTQAPA